MAEFREGIVRRQPDAERWVDRWLAVNGDWIIAQKLEDPAKVKDSHEMKVLRAHRAGLVCLNREYLDYPANWEYKRYRTKHLDGYACEICGAKESEGAVLHAHHIVFRSRSGTNSYRNLVTLCYKHHQAQHDHEISIIGGEPRGKSLDATEENIDALFSEPVSVALPAEFNEHAYSTALPTFESGFDAFRANGRTVREFFVFLIQIFGRNVGKYALKFAAEKSVERRDADAV